MLGLTVIMVGGCDDPDPLPPPGARGPIRLWRWDAERADPMTLVAAGVRQVAGRPGSAEAVLDLEQVRLRAPFSGGIAEVAAPSGRYAAGGDPEAELPAPGASGSVAVVLALRAQIGIGRAQRAWLGADGKGPYLERIDIVHAGIHAVHERAMITDGGLSVTGSGRSRSAPVAVATALAALPADCLGVASATVMGAGVP